jgi:membrane protein
MIGKARPNPDRNVGEVSRQRTSGVFSGMSAKARAGFYAATGQADPALATVRSAAVDAQKSRLPQMAAALSYRTIFGLLPVIIVALVAVKFFASEEQVRTAVEKALEYSGLSAIAVEPEPPMGPPAPVEEADAQIPLVEGEPVEEASVAVAPKPEPPAAVDEWITGLIERVNKVSLGAVTLGGAIMLIYAALAMLVEIEVAFNQIYRVPRGRSWVRRIMQYWTLLTLGPLALIATFWVGQQFMERAQKLSPTVGITLGSPDGSRSVAVTAIGYAVTVAISTAFFLVAYISVPNTKVKLRPALVGAVTAALLWEAGKWGFTKYLSFSDGTAKLYGALALIPLFLLWVYFTWVIVLFGLQIAYQMQHGRAKTRAQPMSETGPTLVDPAAAIVVLNAVARGFESGKTLDAPTLARATALPDHVVRLVVGKLAEKGLLHRIDAAADDAEPCYALARSPSNVRVSEVLELGYELAGSSSSDDAISRLHRAQIDSVADQTLASLAGLGQPVRLPGVENRTPPRTDGGLTVLPGLKERVSGDGIPRPDRPAAKLAEPT